MYVLNVICFCRRVPIAHCLGEVARMVGQRFYCFTFLMQKIVPAL